MGNDNSKRINQMEDELGEILSIEKLTLSDLEAIRLILKGTSVIDWQRLNFESYEAITEFLKVNEFQLNSPKDKRRLERLRDEAVAYLKRTFDFPIPKDIASLSIEELFFTASGKGHRQHCACIILKIMHVIHHLAAQELFHKLPLSEEEIFYLVEEKVYKVIGQLLSKGFPLLEFIGGRKSKDSMILKLLAKEDIIAAKIYDKLRFCIVTRSKKDIFPLLTYLIHKLFPYNYIIPGESVNTLIPFRSYINTSNHLKELSLNFQEKLISEEKSEGPINVFSSADYQVIHFVVDMPVRVDKYLESNPDPRLNYLGFIIFVLTEFQILDRETQMKNEEGESSHQKYKERQKAVVIKRLKPNY
jgi:uncharacterized protein (TIGR04552 family)